MKKFNGKSAVITGGARGIGKAAAIKFAEQGASVVIWDVNDEAGTQLVKEITGNGGKAAYFNVNVTSAESTTDAVKKTLLLNSKIDILVNNAGITRDASFMKMTVEQWQQVIDVNLTGVFNCTKAVVPGMVENKSGRIINTSSVVGLYGNFGQTNYAATKSGIIGMTKVWARELGRKGINVNAVAPGFIATEMVSAMPEAVIKSMQDKTPLGRLGTPDEIASVYLFLASDEASYINGAVISVDGGVVI